MNEPFYWAASGKRSGKVTARIVRKATALLLSVLLMVTQVTPTGFAALAFAADSDSQVAASVLSTQALGSAKVTDQKLWNAEVKLTASDGSLLLLYTGTSKKIDNYEYAVYKTSGDAFADVNDGTKLYHNDGNGYVSEYTGPVNIEFLQDDITRTGVYIFNKAGRTITFKSASKTATDGYPYCGNKDAAKISFTNVGNRLVFQGAGSTYNFENIILDGNNKEAQEGGLIKVGDRGACSNYSATVCLKAGAVLQNSRSNAHDQGAGVYVGYGCKLYMEPGSVIQNCRSVKEYNSSGGAIYLAEGEFYCDGGIIKDCRSYEGAAVDLGGATDGKGSDRARIYLSGKPVIIQNSDSSGKHMNVHLNYDSNEVIQVVGSMSDDAKVGISVNQDPVIFSRHGVEGAPFATVKPGVAVNPHSFVNDRDTDLTAMRSTKDKNLVVWYYPLVMDAVEDYYIDGVKQSSTTLKQDHYFGAENLASFNTASLSEQFLSETGIDLNKGAAFSHVELSSNTGVDGTVYPAVTSGITNIRYVNYGNYGGRRWEYSTNNGKTWNATMGRKLTLHYNRECRDAVEFVKFEDTNPSDKLQGVKFKLERADSANGAYSTYAKGSGKSTTAASGFAVADTSANGVYTTDASGAFVMNLPEGYYRLTETAAADGYEKLGEPITFHVAVTAVPDIAGNEQVSPYKVENVSENAAYSESSYADWRESGVFATLSVGNVRKVALHVLVQDAPGVYELADNLRTTAFTTAGLAEGTKDVSGLNPAAAGYTALHVYYGSQDADGGFSLNTDQEVRTLKGTTDGILLNGAADKKLTKDQAIYYVVYKDPRMVPVHMVEMSLNGDEPTYSLRDEWRTAETRELAVYGTHVVQPSNAGVWRNGYRLAYIAHAASLSELTDSAETSFTGGYLHESDGLRGLTNTTEGVKYNVADDKTGGEYLGTDELYYVFFNETASLEAHVQEKAPNPEGDWHDDEYTNHDADWRVASASDYTLSAIAPASVSQESWDNENATLRYGSYANKAVLKSEYAEANHLAYIYVKVKDGNGQSKLKLDDSVRLMGTATGMKAFVKGADGAVTTYALASNDIFYVYYADPQAMNVYFVVPVSDNGDSITVKALEEDVANWYGLQAKKILYQMDFHNYGRVFRTSNPDIPGWAPNTLPEESGPYQIAYYAIGPDRGTVDVDASTTDDYPRLNNVVIPKAQAFDSEAGMAVRPTENGIEFAEANEGSGRDQRFANSGLSTDCAIYLIYESPYTDIAPTDASFHFMPYAFMLAAGLSLAAFLMLRRRRA